MTLKELFSRLFTPKSSSCCNIQFEEVREDSEKIENPYDEKDEINEEDKVQDSSCGCNCC